MDKPVAVNDEFVSLVLAAKEDAAFRQRLLNILRISEPERRLLVAQLVSESQANDAPPAFVDAPSSLGDDKIARTVIDILISIDN